MTATMRPAEDRVCPSCESVFPAPTRREKYCSTNCAALGAIKTSATTSYCSTCKMDLPVDHFTVARNRPNGRYSRCRECVSKEDEKRMETEAQRARRREREKNRVVDQKKKMAKDAIASAIRGGRVVRWPVCAVPECSRDKPQAHHADYDNPLGVTWLCVKHHRLAHMLIKSAVYRAGITAEDRKS